jgi:hypothetical protein
MLNKIKQIGKYALFIVLTNIIYGLILYFVFTWLAGFSILLAYFGNLALIVAGLVLDELSIRGLESEMTAEKIKTEKEKRQYYSMVRWLAGSYVSFKTVLYLFYIIILVASQIIAFNPALVSENLGNFVLANNYSILFLIAIDMLIRQFSKDRVRIKQISEKLRESLTGDQD